MTASPRFSRDLSSRLSPSIQDANPISPNQAIAPSIDDRDTHVSTDVPNNVGVDHSLPETKPLEALVPVDDLTDVASDDWGMAVLQRFSETYGCAPQLSQGAGTATISRHEFAVMLQNCLEQVRSQSHSQSAQANKL
ncbi:MAG: hypothetical protein ACFB14_04955 [Leptolyngbyaceae cyanobacterium]